MTRWPPARPSPPPSSSLDDDDLTFQITDFAADAAYNFTISGVRVGRNGSYTSVSGSFTVPLEGAAVIKKVEYDRDDREIDIEFAALVQYENPTVQCDRRRRHGPSTPPSTSGMRTASRPRLESPLNIGSEYMVTVTGVRAAQDTALAPPASPSPPTTTDFSTNDLGEAPPAMGGAYPV